MPVFDAPLMLLALIPGLVLWHRQGAESWPTRALRLLALLLLVGALAGPRVVQDERGQDVIVVLDRSLSMGADSEREALELVRLAEDARRPGDRTGVVSFARGARIEQAPHAEKRLQALGPMPDREGSDLAAALDLAASLVPEGRPAVLLLASDGLSSDGGQLDGLARRLAARGITVQTRDLSRSGLADLAVERIELPEQVQVGQPFQFAVWVRATAAAEREFTLRRGDRVLSSGVRQFQPGLNRLVFRDVLVDPGVAAYEVQTVGTSAGQRDRFPENDRGLGAVRALGSARVLCVTSDGAPSSLTTALVSAGLEVVVRAPEQAPIDPLGLTGFRAVVLENTDAGRIGPAGLAALADFVTERGGGLLLTGGQASFGRGGYFRSAVDPLLPVSMELRQEQRKFGVALGIALDRSGSMSAPAGGGTKMDLANEGTAAAIETLSYLDSVAVFAVDSEAHVVQPLVEVEDPASIISRVRGIRSMGGGIYVYEALVATWAELENANQANRHIVLFSDAADSESQTGCLQFVRDHLDEGLSLSVIALGTESDSDAQFLKILAEAGGGTAYFTTQPEDLPRLFSQEVMTISRATFIDQSTGTATLPGLLGLGDLPPEGFPSVAGYNLTYPRPEATLGVVTTDEYAAPLLAFCYRGLGRTAVYTGQLGGEFGADVVAWPGFRAAFSGLVRWLNGLEEPGDVFARATRVGNEVVLSVEVDPDSPLPAELAVLEASVLEPDGSRRELVLERAGANRFEARLELQTAGVRLSTLKLGGDRFVDLPPVALPYSSEFAPGLDPDRGPRLLRELGQATGGGSMSSADQLFTAETTSARSKSLLRAFLIAALVIGLVEIAGRRLSLWASLPSFAPLVSKAQDLAARRSAGAPPTEAAPAPRADASKPAAESPSTIAEAPDIVGEPEASPEPPQPPPSSPQGDMTSALEAARNRAKRRLR